MIIKIESVSESRSVVSDSLWPHWLQDVRLLCPALSPGVCSNSCPLSQWFYLTISSSATPFFFCLPSFPASGSFPMTWLFTSGSQSIGASASPSVLLVNIQGWVPLGLTGFISLLLQGTLKSLLHMCVDLSLGFLFCSIDLYSCLCASTILSW